MDGVDGWVVGVEYVGLRYGRIGGVLVGVGCEVGGVSVGGVW